jgi:DNA mismatch repair protein MutH
MDIKNKIYGGAKMQEKEIEVSQQELIEVVRRLSVEVMELQQELKMTKEELKRVKRWVGQVSEFAIKKSIQGGQK